MLEREPLTHPQWAWPANKGSAKKRGRKTTTESPRMPLSGITFCLPCPKRVYACYLVWLRLCNLSSVTSGVKMLTSTGAVAGLRGTALPVRLGRRTARCVKAAGLVCRADKKQSLVKRTTVSERTEDAPKILAVPVVAAALAGRPPSFTDSKGLFSCLLSTLNETLASHSNYSAVCARACARFCADVLSMLPVFSHLN